MVIHHVREPDLEFGNGTHVDIRYGLMDHLPHDVYQPRRPDRIRLGIVGTAQSIEGASGWIERCRERIERKESPKRNLFPEFPGYRETSCFRSEIVLDESLNHTLTPREIRHADSDQDYETVVRNQVALFLEAVEDLAQKAPDVILISMPVELLEIIAVAEAGRNDGKKRIKAEFHDLLKGAALRCGKPLQFLRPSTYDPKLRRGERDEKGQSKSLQDEATRAWNFFTALYYKAGGFPYRVTRPETDYQTCFIGISFFVSPDKTSVKTAVAQVFNERGHGLAVKGMEAVVSSTDKQPHLSREDAEQLMRNCLRAYRREHKTTPARVVIHKTSDFDAGEAAGFHAGLDDVGIDLRDFLRLDRSYTRLFREGYYPPLRGTWLEADGVNAILYTRGSVNFYEEYPGMYVPRSLRMRIAEASSPMASLVEEILTLTKTNWNNVQIDATLPITITASRKVGEILRWLPGEDPSQQSYRFYM
jgi:hypothetical protein